MNEVSMPKVSLMPSRPSAIESWRMFAPVKIRVEKVILSSGALANRLPVGSAFRLTAYLRSAAMEPLCNVSIAPTPGYASANCRSSTTCKLGFPRRVTTRTIRFDPPDAISFPITIAHVPLGAHISCKLTSMDDLYTPAIEFIVPVFSPSGLLLQGRHLVPFRYRRQWRHNKSPTKAKSLDHTGEAVSTFQEGFYQQSDCSAASCKTDEESTSSRSSLCSSANLISSLSSFSDSESCDSVFFDRYQHCRLLPWSGNSSQQGYRGSSRRSSGDGAITNKKLYQPGGERCNGAHYSLASPGDLSSVRPRPRNSRVQSKPRLRTGDPNTSPPVKRFRMAYTDGFGKINSCRQYHSARWPNGASRCPSAVSQATHCYKLLDLFDRGLIRPIGSTTHPRKALDERHLRILRSKCLRYIRSATTNGLCFAAVSVPVFDFAVFKVAAPGASSSCTTCNSSSSAASSRTHRVLPSTQNSDADPPTAISGPEVTGALGTLLHMSKKNDGRSTLADYYWSPSRYHASTSSRKLYDIFCAEWFRDTFNGPHKGTMAGAETAPRDFEPLLVRHYWYERPSPCQSSRSGGLYSYPPSSNSSSNRQAGSAAPSLLSSPGEALSVPETEDEGCASAPAGVGVNGDVSLSCPAAGLKQSSARSPYLPLGRSRTATAALQQPLKCQPWQHIPGASEETTLELLTMAPALPALWQLAAQTLDRAPEEILSRYLLQLIQSLRFDDGGPLLSVLLRRSLVSRVLASQLYWGLECETEDKVEGQRFLAAQAQLAEALADSKATESGGLLQTIELQRRLVRMLRWLSARLAERRDRAERKTERLRSLLTSSDAAAFMTESSSVDGEQRVRSPGDLRSKDVCSLSTSVAAVNESPASLLELPIPIPVPIRPTEGFLIGVIPERSFVVKSSQYPIVLAWKVLVPSGSGGAAARRPAQVEVEQASESCGPVGPTLRRRRVVRRPRGRRQSERLQLMVRSEQKSKHWVGGKARNNIPPGGDSAGPKRPDSLVGLSSEKLRNVFSYEVVERRYLFKTGDDLRQDLMVSRLLQMLDALLLSYGCDFRLAIYDVVAFSRSDGLIEFIEDSESISSVKKTHPSLRHYFAAHAPDPASPLGFSQSVLSSFIRSCSAYCVITFILGVGDRHLDNLLVCRDGRLFHVDYGFLFGDDPKPFPPPMKLCAEMIEALGSMGSQSYTEFQLRCCQCFRSLRRHSTLILDVLALMSRSGLRGFRTEASYLLSGVQQKFQLGLTEAQAEAALLDVVAASANAFLPAVVDKFHEWAVYWK